MDNCISSLNCQENETCLEEVVDEDTFIYLKNCNASEDDYVGMLFEKAISFGFKNDESLVIGDWVKRARLEAISWILKSRATFGFRFQTAYLSVTYFDQFLCTQSINSEKAWAIQLLSVACLSLAAKMEESNPPVLSAFQLEDYSFESKVIQRMELLVLSTLQWKMGFISPFDFLPYFITKFCIKPPPSNIMSRTMKLILAIMKDINLMDYQPSVIAAAATLVASDPQLTRKAMELKMNSISHSKLVETEDVFVCYNLIRRLEIEKSRVLNSLNSQNQTPTSSRPINVSESFAGNTKRKKLKLDDTEQNSGIGDGKRLC
ncbi:Cyclin-D5-1 [Quillaja saponaria]|uniref:B-like cyclin n=1 Tax=Quillaja saponaria TaxID=32244 RepID=A0AAD7PJU7_QUISA|nr:Cyclin-D5-1 [Quillaja saponaria]